MIITDLNVHFSVVCMGRSEGCCGWSGGSFQPGLSDHHQPQWALSPPVFDWNTGVPLHPGICTHPATRSGQHSQKHRQTHWQSKSTKSNNLCVNVYRPREQTSCAIWSSGSPVYLRRPYRLLTWGLLPRWQRATRLKTWPCCWNELSTPTLYKEDTVTRVTKTFITTKLTRFSMYLLKCHFRSFSLILMLHVAN